MSLNDWLNWCESAAKAICTKYLPVIENGGMEEKDWDEIVSYLVAVGNKVAAPYKRDVANYLVENAVEPLDALDRKRKEALAYDIAVRECCLC